MKPAEKKPDRVFRIIDRKSGGAQGSYSRSCHDEFDFASVSQARNANCHDRFQDHDKYAIAEYEVTYTLISLDVDDIQGPEGMTLSDIEACAEVIREDAKEDRYISLPVERPPERKWDRSGAYIGEAANVIIQERNALESETNSGELMNMDEKDIVACDGSVAMSANFTDDKFSSSGLNCIGFEFKGLSDEAKIEFDLLSEQFGVWCIKHGLYPGAES